MSPLTNHPRDRGTPSPRGDEEPPEAPDPVRMELTAGKLGDQPSTVLTLHFTELTASVREEIAKEILWSRGAPAELVLPLAALMDESRVHLHYRPLELRTRLLLDLVGALPWKNEPALVLSLVSQLAAVLERSSEWPSPARLRGSLTLRSIFIGPDGQIRLLGGGPRTRHLVLERSHPGEVLQWAAPEAVRDGPSRSGDVHALAALCYELLFGAPFRSRERSRELLARPAEEQPSPLPQLSDLHGTAASALLRRALSLDPEQRPETPRAFALELASALKLDTEGPALTEQLARRLRALPHNPSRTGLSALIQRPKPEHREGRDPTDALAAWSVSLANDQPAALPRGHSSGIEPILLGQTPRSLALPDSSSSLDSEPYRIEKPRPTGRRPSLEDVLETRRRKRRLKWLAAVFVLLLISAVAHQSLDLPLAHWLHARLDDPGIEPGVEP